MILMFSHGDWCPALLLQASGLANSAHTFAAESERSTIVPLELMAFRGLLKRNVLSAQQ